MFSRASLALCALVVGCTSVHAVNTEEERPEMISVDVGAMADLEIDPDSIRYRHKHAHKADHAKKKSTMMRSTSEVEAGDDDIAVPLAGSAIEKAALTVSDESECKGFCGDATVTMKWQHKCIEVKDEGSPSWVCPLKAGAQCEPSGKVKDHTVASASSKEYGRCVQHENEILHESTRPFFDKMHYARCNRLGGEDVFECKEDNDLVDEAGQVECNNDADCGLSHSKNDDKERFKMHCLAVGDGKKRCHNVSSDTIQNKAIMAGCGDINKTCEGNEICRVSNIKVSDPGQTYGIEYECVLKEP